MSTDDVVDVLCLAYFALVVPASIGVFTHGATGLAVLVAVCGACLIATAFNVASPTPRTGAHRHSYP